jgi:hypothetical protein
MKTTFIIPVHSFVDLITNSSSELFVCSTKKSIEAVKRIVEEIYSLWYQEAEDSEKRNYPDSSQIWKEVFREPENSKYFFDFYSLPQEIRDEYLKYHDWYYEFENTYKGNFEKTKEYQNASRKEKDARLAIEKEYLSLFSCSSVHELYEKHKDAYDEMINNQNEAYRKAWKSWENKKSAAFNNVIKHALLQNGFSQEDIQNFKENEVVGKNVQPMKANVLEFAYFVEDCLFWSFNVKKGDILIKTQRDNSAPYEIFGAIESMLNARRIHMG